MNPRRDDLRLMEMTEEMILWTREDDPSLAKSMEAVDDNGKRELGGIIGRFSRGPEGVQDPRIRLQVRRLLGRLRKMDADMLVTLNRILDYMDLNADARLGKEEMELCLQLFEKFSGLVSHNQSLSAVELDLLYAVLRFADRNGNGRLEKSERESLLTHIQGGRSFLRQQLDENPDFLRIAQEHQLNL